MNTTTTAALLLAATLPAADARTVTLHAAKCREATAVLPLPTARAQAALPHGYTAAPSTFGAPGTTDLIVAALECEDLRADRVTVPRARISEIGIGILTPDGSPGAHFYEAEWTTSSRRIQDAVRRTGLKTHRALIDFDLGDGEHGEAQVGGTHRIVVDVAAPFPQGDTATWWQGTGRHRVRLGYRFPGIAVRAGSAQVSAERGSVVEQLTGHTLVDGLGAAITFGLDAVIGRG